MGIALVRLPAYEVNLSIYTGRITPDEALRSFRDLDPDDPANAPRWLTYIDENTDLSGIPVTAYPEAKHVLIPKLKRLSERPGYSSAVVCSSAHFEWLIDFWRDYVEQAPDYTSRRVFFSNLKDACDWLELPASGCEAIEAQIEARTEARHDQAPRAARPERAGGGPHPVGKAH